MFADYILKLIREGKVQAKSNEVLMMIRKSHRISVNDTVCPIIDDVVERLRVARREKDNDTGKALRDALALGGKLPFNPLWLEFPWTTRNGCRIAVYLEEFEPNQYAGTILIQVLGKAEEKTLYVMEYAFEWRSDGQTIRDTGYTAISNVYNNLDAQTVSALGELKDAAPSALSLYCLVTLNLLLETKTTSFERGVPDKNRLVKGTIQKGLTYSVLKLNLGTRTPKQVVRHLLYTIRKRLHDVQGHWRRYNLTEGCAHEWIAREHEAADDDESLRHYCTKCMGFRVWIEEHERGDETLGRVIHDYELVSKHKEHA